MESSDRQLAQQLAEIPFDDLLASMGRGVAEAQSALDKMSSMVALSLSGKYQVETSATGEWVLVPHDTRVLFGGEALSLLELGFTPSFYQFVDTILEIKVSVSMTREETASVERRDSTTERQTWTEGGFLGIGGTQQTRTNTTTVSSQFASRFQYSAEGASVVRTKLVPVPPPAALAGLVRELAAART
jgi:hypothetical protein